MRDLHLEEAAAQSPQLGSILVILHIGKDETLVALNCLALPCMEIYVKIITCLSLRVTVLVVTLLP